MDTAYLKEQKEKMKMSFDEIAKISGVSRRSCVGVINGEEKYINPSHHTLISIEQALGIYRGQTKMDVTQDEELLIELYRKLPPQYKKSVRLCANSFLDVYINEIIKEKTI